jgi:hypothetical protein
VSKQNKQRNKRSARQQAKTEQRTAPAGASGLPHHQLAPPWVGNGKRMPRKAREALEAKRAAEAEAKRQAIKQAAKREAPNEA